MDAETYSDAGVAKELSGWAVARIDVSRRPEVAKLLGVQAVPSAVVLDPSGAVQGRLEGAEPAEAFLKRLRARWPVEPRAGAP